MKNIDADADYVINTKFTDDKLSITQCKHACDEKDKCDFFMYLHETQQCDMWEFKRRSNLLQVGLTDDAIFCIKQGKLYIKNVLRTTDILSH